MPLPDGLAWALRIRNEGEALVPARAGVEEVLEQGAIDPAPACGSGPLIQGLMVAGSLLMVPKRRNGIDRQPPPSLTDAMLGV